MTVVSLWIPQMSACRPHCPPDTGNSFSRAAIAIGMVALMGDLWPCSAQPPPVAYVQGNAAVPQTAQSVVTVAFTAAQTAGNLNVAVVGWRTPTAHVRSVGDTAGNEYTLAVGPTVRSGFGTLAIYSARNIQAAAPGGNVVSVSFDAPAQLPDIRIAEYSGLDPTNPVDVTAANQGNKST